MQKPMTPSEAQERRRTCAFKSKLKWQEKKSLASWEDVVVPALVVG